MAYPAAWGPRHDGPGARRLGACDGSGRAPVRDGAVAIGQDGAIAAVGAFEELRRRFPDHAELAGDGNSNGLPGFVNAHTHLTEGLLPGMGETATLWEWFERVVNPAGRAWSAKTCGSARASGR